MLLEWLMHGSTGKLGTVRHLGPGFQRSCTPIALIDIGVTCDARHQPLTVQFCSQLTKHSWELTE